MKNHKNILFLTAVFLTPVILIFGILIGVKNNKYHDALEYADNYLFLGAQERFLELKDYRDSAQHAEKMTQLTEINKTEFLKLLPGAEKESQFQVTYWCLESNLGLKIDWDPDNEDLYSCWGPDYILRTDKALADTFFGTDLEAAKIIRYDQSTGEYIFLLYTGDNALFDHFMPMEEVYRGKLNADGNLEIYNSEGEHYLFWIYSSHDCKSVYGKIILNPELTPFVEGTAPES